MTRMNAWEQCEEHAVIRLLALRLLLERSEHAVAKGSRTSEDSVHVEGGRPSGWPPAPAVPSEAFRQAEKSLRDLHAVRDRESGLTPTPRESRRIAELLEFLDRDEEARRWWEIAALRGDRDARDYLDILDAEGEGKPSSCPDRPGEEFRYPEEFPSTLDFSGHESIGSRMRADRHDPASGDAGLCMPEQRQSRSLAREAEQFLTHPDRLTDGRRC